MNREHTGAVLARLAEFSTTYDENHFTPRVNDVGLSRDSIVTVPPEKFLSFLYRHYAFNRAGGAKAGYHEIALAALEETGSVNPDGIWEAFQRGCDDRGVGVNARVNHGAVRETAALVQTHGNLFNWVGETVERTGEITPAYTTISDVRGFGEKISRFFIRDAVWVTGTEHRVPDDQAMYLHPMDVWTRRIAHILFEEMWTASDNDIATKLANACSEHNVSHAAVNQGAWYFAAKEHEGDSQAVVRNLLSHV